MVARLSHEEFQDKESRGEAAELASIMRKSCVVVSVSIICGRRDQTIIIGRNDTILHPATTDVKKRSSEPASSCADDIIHCRRRGLPG